MRRGQSRRDGIDRSDGRVLQRVLVAGVGRVRHDLVGRGVHDHGVRAKGRQLGGRGQVEQPFEIARHGRQLSGRVVRAPGARARVTAAGNPGWPTVPLALVSARQAHCKVARATYGAGGWKVIGQSCFHP